MARGFGATNQLGVSREFGWTTVALTDAGRADAVLGQLPDPFPIFQWHSDTFTLPKGAIHLATSSVAGCQAFRVGRATYATQFHFEANRNVVADWVRSFPDLIDHAAPGWRAMHPHGTQTAGRLADQHGLAIARAWVALI